MVGIVSFGAYIPVMRLSREDIARAWGRPSLGGERSVANNDEDTATMAVEAAFDCLGGMDPDRIDALFFASTTPPYREKQIACMLAAVTDLREEILTVDFANSLRAGADALRIACHAIQGGGARSVLVAAADSRLGYPRSDFEQSFGDGAAAMLLGKERPIANLVESLSIANEMMDVWRNPEDRFIRSGEARWVLQEGYAAVMQRAVGTLLERCRLKPGDIQKAVLSAPDLRSHRNLAGRLGFATDTVQDPLISDVGNCGCAQPLMMLAGALEEASPGDRILVGAYGDGADVLLFQVTEEIRRFPKRRGIKGNLASKLMIPSYERYLSFRGILETVPGEPFRLLPSATVSWRDRDSILRCYGSRCRNCGTSVFPIQRVCYSCMSRDDYDKIRLSGEKGRVFTFSLDNLAGRSDDPVVVQTVVELDRERTRFYCMMTDCVPSDVRVGMPVELTFRRLYEGAGFHNYFWKCRPARYGGV